MNMNNIRAFIKNGNDVVIERVHALVAWLVVNRKVPLSLATDVNLNEVIQVAMYLKPGSYILMMPAFGLAVPNEHNAQACNDAAMAVLKHYGIRRNDIVLSINDTMNTSFATSQLIIGTDGTCNMHLANLACDHAIGK
ncbi:unnamed protein product [Sphagnum balticum]